LDEREIGGLPSKLKRQIGRKLLIVWDCVDTYKSRRVRQWLEQQDGRIASAFTPSYAPKLSVAK
jgi:hypothetical protein